MTYTLPDIPQHHFLLIKTDGTEELRPFPSPPGFQRIETMVAALGFDTLDFSTLTKDHWGRAKLLMVVNDKGWETDLVQHGPGRFELVPTTANFPVNDKATDLYRAIAPTSEHQIVGDVAVLNDDD